MTSQNRKPGRWPKDLNPLKHEILRELSTGQKRWTDFENNPRIYSLARSTGPISRALKELEREGVIEKGFISHKNRPYFLTKDAEALRSLESLETILAQFRETLTSTDRFRYEPSISSYDVEVVQSILYKIQLVFLKTMDILSNVNPVAKPYVKSWFTNEILDTMLEIYEACRNRLPQTTQRALLYVTKMTTEKSFTSSSSQIAELEKIDTILQMLVDYLYNPTLPR